MGHRLARLAERDLNEIAEYLIQGSGSVELAVRILRVVHGHRDLGTQSPPRHQDVTRGGVWGTRASPATGAWNESA